MNFEEGKYMKILDRILEKINRIEKEEDVFYKYVSIGLVLLIIVQYYPIVFYFFELIEFDSVGKYGIVASLKIMFLTFLAAMPSVVLILLGLRLIEKTDSRYRYGIGTVFILSGLIGAFFNGLLGCLEQTSWWDI